MSYGFTVTRDDEGIRLDPIGEGALTHIPHGQFQISGHVPTEGMSKVATLAVTLTKSTDSGNQHVGSASASYAT